MESCQNNSNSATQRNGEKDDLPLILLRYVEYGARSSPGSQETDHRSRRIRNQLEPAGQYQVKPISPFSIKAALNSRNQKRRGLLPGAGPNLK